MNKEPAKPEVSIITFPLSDAGRIPLVNLARLIGSLSNKLNIISGGQALENLKLTGNIFITKVNHKTSSNVCARIFNHILTQLKFSIKVLIASKQTDYFIFFIGGEGLFFPMLTLKFLRKKSVLMLGGIATKGYLARKDSLSNFVSFLTNLTFSFPDKLIVYSDAMIQEGKLDKYQNKIIIAHEHFINFEKFKMTTHYNKRPELVGYLGRLSGEKGILNFIKAIPLVLKEKSTTGFMVCGDGKLYDEVIENIAANRVSQNVKLIKWIKHEEVPIYLNSLKLLVVPSFTEGLPNVILEAMACGTPVLATPVGAITDIIKEGETGFLLKSNTPLNIAKQIIILLNKPALLEKVSKNAYDWVRLNFSEEQTIETWRKILQDLNANNK